MADKAWKKAERELAKILGGHRRLRHTGEPGDDPGDVLGVEGLFIEVKYRKNHALWKTWQKASESAGLAHPAVFLRQHGTGGFLVVCHLNEIHNVARKIKAARERVKNEQVCESSGDVHQSGMEGT